MENKSKVSKDDSNYKTAETTVNLLDHKFSLNNMIISKVTQDKKEYKIFTLKSIYTYL